MAGAAVLVGVVASIASCSGNGSNAPSTTQSPTTTTTTTTQSQTRARPDVAHRLTAVRQLSEALKVVPRTDPEGIVMAAVRAIEHCKHMDNARAQTVE